MSTDAGPLPPDPRHDGEVRWDEQINVWRVALDSTMSGAVAAYIAKYATKSTDAFGRLDHRLHESDLVALDLRPHVERLVTTAWDLGGRPELDHLKPAIGHTPSGSGAIGSPRASIIRRLSERSVRHGPSGRRSDEIQRSSEQGFRLAHPGRLEHLLSLIRRSPSGVREHP